MLLPPSIQEWLPEQHMARFVVEIVEQLDLREITSRYGGSGGRRAYHPAMMVALLFYGYATGVFSSRKLEEATHDSVGFRYITGNEHPDHDMGRLCRRNAPCSAASALLARRSTRLADGLQVDVAGRDTLRIAARRTCIFAVASSDPGRGLPSTDLPLPAIGTIGNDPLCSTASAPSIMAVNPCIVLPASSVSHACRGSFCGCA